MTRPLVILIRMNVELLAEYPIRTSQSDITAEGPCVNAKHDEIRITVIVTRLFCFWNMLKLIYLSFRTYMLIRQSYLII